MCKTKLWWTSGAHRHARRSVVKHCRAGERWWCQRAERQSELYSCQKVCISTCFSWCDTTKTKLICHLFFMSNTGLISNYKTESVAQLHMWDKTHSPKLKSSKKTLINQLAEDSGSTFKTLVSDATLVLLAGNDPGQLQKQHSASRVSNMPWCTGTLQPLVAKQTPNH